MVCKMPPLSCYPHLNTFGRSNLIAAAKEVAGPKDIMATGLTPAQELGCGKIAADFGIHITIARILVKESIYGTVFNPNDCQEEVDPVEARIKSEVEAQVAAASRRSFWHGLMIGFTVLMALRELF